MSFLENYLFDGRMRDVKSVEVGKKVQLGGITYILTDKAKSCYSVKNSHVRHMRLTYYVYGTADRTWGLAENLRRELIERAMPKLLCNRDYDVYTVTFMFSNPDASDDYMMYAYTLRLNNGEYNENIKYAVTLKHLFTPHKSKFLKYKGEFIEKNASGEYIYTYAESASKNPDRKDTTPEQAEESPYCVKQEDAAAEETCAGIEHDKECISDGSSVVAAYVLDCDKNDRVNIVTIGNSKYDPEKDTVAKRIFDEYKQTTVRQNNVENAVYVCNMVDRLLAAKKFVTDTDEHSAYISFTYKDLAEYDISDKMPDTRDMDLNLLCEYINDAFGFAKIKYFSDTIHGDSEDESTVRFHCYLRD